MDRLLYTGMVAAKETEYRQSANSHNISNAQSDGFKREIVATRALHSTGPGLSTRVYAMAHSTGIDASEGSVKFTNLKNDLTVRGQDWFVVKDNDGRHLVKNISFSVNSQGELIDQSGSKLETSQGIVLVPNAADVFISDSGQITFKLPEQPQMIIAGELKVVTATSELLSKNRKGQIVSVEMNESAFPRVVIGARQTSNVSAVSAAMESVNLSNQFNMNMKIFDSAKRMSEQTSRLIGN